MTSTVSELMDRDPLKLTHEDITEICRYYREARLAAAAAPAKKTSSKSKAPASDLDSIEL